MGIKALPIIVIAIAILIASLSVAFNDYLLTAIIGTNNTTSSNNTVGAGQTIRLTNPALNTDKNISIHICNATRGCFPIVANVTTAPKSVRIPIGYPNGAATITISEHLSKKQLYSMPVIVQ